MIDDADKRAEKELIGNIMKPVMMIAALLWGVKRSSRK